MSHEKMIPQIPLMPLQEPDFYVRPYLTATESNTLEIPYLLYLIHRVRQGFEQDMPLETTDGRALFLYWWINFGKKEYGIEVDLLSEHNRKVLNEPCGTSKIGPLQWTRLARAAHKFEVYFAETDVVRPVQPDTESALKWFYGSAVPRRDLFSLLDSDARSFLAGAADDEMGASPKIFELRSGDQILDDSSLEVRCIQRFLSPQGPAPARLEPIQQLPMQKGVNIIGLAKSVSGIGEDARMAALALDAAGVPYDIIPFPGKLGKPPRYNVNLLCMSGFQSILARAQLGPEVFSNRYTIGFFPWELPDWPLALNPSLDACDEIWCSSEFILQAVKRATQTPAYQMPMTVDYDLSSIRTSKVLSREDGVVYVLFIFDFISGAERKNIWGCLEAFQKAFEGRRDVRLVVKALNMQPNLPEVQRYQELASRDDRIITLNMTLDRSEQMNLIASCDIFLSLHRAEGFGRCLAEALLLGKQVIATGFSGNVDFTTPDNSLLVDYRMIPVAAREYVFSENQTWAEALIEDAAVKLRHALEQAQKKSINESGIKTMTEKYSKEVVGKLYRETLISRGLI